MFRLLRENEGWSQNECAKYIGVDVRAIARLEYGLYTSPLPSCVDYWVNRGKTTVPELLTQYEDFVYNHRKDSHRAFGNLHVSLSDRTHPFRVLRAYRGLSETVKLMCVPLDTVQYWEKKWRNQKSVPKSILLALNQMGYSQLELAKFSEAYKAWRKIHLKDMKTVQARPRKTKSIVRTS